MIRKKKPVSESVLQLARQRVREAFLLFDTVAVSFSGGKDSTAVLNLAIEAAEELGRLPLLVFHYDEEAIPYETEAYVRRVSRDPRLNFQWLCLPIQHRNACSRKQPFWYPWAAEDKEKWVRAMPPEAVTFDQIAGFPADPAARPTLPDSVGLLFNPAKHGRVGMLLGIRADESLTRTRAILMQMKDTRSYVRTWEGGYSKGNLFKVYPVYDWRTADIWTAPAELGWDYNTSYDLMDKAGISPSQQRVAPPYGEEPLAGLWMYSCCFPDIWQKMVNRVPGAATAARYSQSELYSYNTMPEKPAEMSNEEWLRHWLLKHPPGHREEIAARVSRWLKNHYNKTKEPLAYSAMHPKTGICWKFLVNIAIRGDYKGRRQSSVQKSDYEKNKKRYDAEIAVMRAAGELK